MSGDQLVEPGYFYRLGIAAPAGRRGGRWLIRTLGARPARPGSGMRQVHGLPWPRPDADPASSESGADSELLWIGRMPVAIFTAVSDEGPLALYVARHGTGLHSVAWTVQDLWGTETIARRRNIRITGVDLPGRHFFLHPADTSGLLVEFTDTEFEEDPRDGAALKPGPDPLVPVEGLAWLTVVVRDAEKSAARLSSLVSAELVPGLPAGEPEAESTIDLRVGDVVIRLVSPKRPDSRYAEPLESKGERLTSVGFAVADLDVSVARLSAQGIGVTHRDKHRAWSDRPLRSVSRWSGRTHG